VLHLKTVNLSGHRWLAPVIPATQEAEVRRITVRGQPGQTVLETLSQNTHHKKMAQDVGPEFKPQCSKKKKKSEFTLYESQFSEIERWLGCSVVSTGLAHARPGVPPAAPQRKSSRTQGSTGSPSSSFAWNPRLNPGGGTCNPAWPIRALHFPGFLTGSGEGRRLERSQSAWAPSSLRMRSLLDPARPELGPNTPLPLPAHRQVRSSGLEKMALDPPRQPCQGDSGRAPTFQVLAYLGRHSTPEVGVGSPGVQHGRHHRLVLCDEQTQHVGVGD
jgi:hypothetical protein